MQKPRRSKEKSLWELSVLFGQPTVPFSSPFCNRIILLSSCYSLIHVTSNFSGQKRNSLHQKFIRQTLRHQHLSSLKNSHYSRWRRSRRALEGAIFKRIEWRKAERVWRWVPELVHLPATLLIYWHVRDRLFWAFDGCRDGFFSLKVLILRSCQWLISSGALYWTFYP